VHIIAEPAIGYEDHLQHSKRGVVNSVAGDFLHEPHPANRTPTLELRLYNSGMPLQVDAVYENGVLRPLQPLDLKEHEHVRVSVVQDTAPSRASLAVGYIEKIKRELQDAESAPGLEEVRRRLAKIPGSMAADIVADRGER
jgi:predicted DNA-binding antitoxin AbrB/MazE fold protein